MATVLKEGGKELQCSAGKPTTFFSFGESFDLYWIEKVLKRGSDSTFLCEERVFAFSGCIQIQGVLPANNRQETEDTPLWPLQNDYQVRRETNTD